MVPISGGHWARGRVHPGQVTSPSQGNAETHKTNSQAHTHTEQQFREPNNPVIFLDFGRKLECPDRSIHTCDLFLISELSNYKCFIEIRCVSKLAEVHKQEG
ncbi:hypothetical protein AMECASPLE_039137 [Ameca splendens]|uniref:Uncharacterized protein n=1 Tax=Ameca splendens TaxID=208324 RepID=A0ABV0XXC0_9TELE